MSERTIRDELVEAQFYIRTRAEHAGLHARAEAHITRLTAELEAMRQERDGLATRVEECTARWARLGSAMMSERQMSGADMREVATLRDCANELGAALRPAPDAAHPEQGQGGTLPPPAEPGSESSERDEQG